MCNITAMNKWNKFSPLLCIAALVTSCHDATKASSNPSKQDKQDRNKSEALVAICAVKFADGRGVRNPEIYSFSYDRKTRRPLGQWDGKLISLAELQKNMQDENDKYHPKESKVKVRADYEGKNIALITETSWQKQDHVDFFSATFNTNDLTLTRHVGSGSTHKEAFSSREVYGAGKCEILEFPFKTKDKNQKSFATFLEQKIEWGVPEAKILSTGKCKDGANVDYAYRSMICRDVFVQKISPMGRQVCKLNEVEAKVATAKILGREQVNLRPAWTFRTSANDEPDLNLELGECRWKN